MANERIAPDAILAQTNLSGAVAAIQDDPDSPDANWLTAPGSNNDTSVRVSFPSPSANLSVGAGLQEFRVQVRKTNHSTDPTASIALWESGSLIAEVLAATTVSSTTGAVLSATWNASLLGDVSGADAECRVIGTVGGGNPGNRASLEVGAIEWNAEVSNLAEISATGSGTSGGSATITGTGVLSATATSASSGSASIVGTGALSAVSSGTSSGSASIANLAELSATGSGTSSGSAAITGLGQVSASATGTSSGSAAITGLGVLSAAGGGTSSGSAQIQDAGGAPSPDVLKAFSAVIQLMIMRREV